ncbi:hypothetical protein SUGI_0661420 [Cryptomeria japonica]|nr:hypothetical protein SUGI_0661420 [Cryptomeria japonica]
MKSVYPKSIKKVKKYKDMNVNDVSSSQNPKTLLQMLVSRAGYGQPHYKIKHMNDNQFRAMVEFNGMQFVGRPCYKKRSAEQEVAMKALAWLTSASHSLPIRKNNEAIPLTKMKKKECELVKSIASRW